MKQKIVIFDFDNTIIHSIKLWRKAINIDLFKKHGLKPNPEIKKMHGGKSNLEIAQIFVDLSGIKTTAKKIVKEWYDIMFDYYTTKAKIIKGAKEYISKLKSEGKKVVLASATGEELLLPVVKELGFDVLFDEIHTENTVGAPKRDPMFYVKLLEKLDAKPEDVFVFEDSYYAIASATSLRIECGAIICKATKNRLTYFNDVCSVVIKDYNDKKLSKL